MTRPKTLHDFYGFPQALFDVQYPAPGLPELAEEIAEVVKPTYVGADVDSWGLDHGTWSVLVHAFPDADVPVVQLAIDARRPPAFHFELGARLAALRERGVLLMGSGNVVHNLGAIDWRQPDGAFDWNLRFDAHARETMTSRPADAVALVDHGDYAMSAPTPEHFLPLLYIAGFAAATGQPADVLVEGPAYGSLSMASYTVGAPGANTIPHLPGTAPIASDAPPEATNL
jgi:4,5-DOPA dioxygenase extradiol